MGEGGGGAAAARLPALGPGPGLEGGGSGSVMLAEYLVARDETRLAGAGSGAGAGLLLLVRELRRDMASVLWDASWGAPEVFPQEAPQQEEGAPILQLEREVLYWICIQYAY